MQRTEMMIVARCIRDSGLDLRGRQLAMAAVKRACKLMGKPEYPGTAAAHAKEMWDLADAQAGLDEDEQHLRETEEYEKALLDLNDQIQRACQFQREWEEAADDD